MEITPTELNAMRERKEMIFLIDVRTQEEWAIARLRGATLIPLSELAMQIPHIKEVLGDRRVVTYCHHGNRSLVAARMLQRAGIPAVSLRGGIEAWSEQIDPTVARY